ncbi:MAG: primosomal protein N' [Planctomycetes bacterium]|nr:primosomal protein N' [Planctomycetota bacterium]
MPTPDSTLFAPDTPTAYPWYVRVAVERGIDILDGPDGFTYGCGDPPPRIGEHVMVPLGKGDRPAPGVVLEVGGAALAAGVPPNRIKPITSTSGALLPPSLMKLGAWMAEYYLCPLGMVLASVMPAPVKAGTGSRNIAMVDREPSPPDETQLRGHAAKMWDAVKALPHAEFPMPLKELSIRCGAKTVATARALVAAGFLRQFDETHVRAAALKRADWELNKTLDLTDEQSAAVDGIAAAFGSFSVHLLRGVTGSGKTEVYLRLISQTISEGRTALVLVPEIALTPQTAARFTGRLGEDRVAVLHSGLTAAQRHKEWRRACEGEARVVVGARSAVFAPLANLGLIVVDEEHDSSYKQDRLPRYNGRDVAIKRGQLEACPVVLGSATPSMESWHNATSQPPRFQLWSLTRRVGGASLPVVTLVDMTEERRKRYQMGPDRFQHLLGPTLEAALEKTLREPAQAILLLNRRGFASYISCQNKACGHVLGCDQCDANLVLHRTRHFALGGFVRCHHCEAEQMVPTKCPVCGGKLNLFSGGTQRLEEELARKYAALGIEEGRTMLRVDSDSMRGGGEYAETLARFASGEVRLLVGTQMLAKGLDFPGVRLVGIIDADTALHIPDFRSAERTFQLVSQVAGRAGRGEQPGTVIVQTHCPTNPAIILASRHDYVTFAELEMSVRKGARLPPVSRMARIVCRDKSAEKAQEAGRELAAALREAAPPDAAVRGPIPCPIERIAGQFRTGIDVTAPTAAALSRLLASLRAKGLLKSDTRTAVDVDPVALM